MPAQPWAVSSTTQPLTTNGPPAGIVAPFAGMSIVPRRLPVPLAPGPAVQTAVLATGAPGAGAQLAGTCWANTSIETALTAMNATNEPRAAPSTGPRNVRKR